MAQASLVMAVAEMLKCSVSVACMAVLDLVPALAVVVGFLSACREHLKLSSKSRSSKAVYRSMLCLGDRLGLNHICAIV